MVFPLNMDKEWDYANSLQIGPGSEISDYQNVVALNEDVLNLHLERGAFVSMPTWLPIGAIGNATCREQEYACAAYRGEAFEFTKSF